jgi:aldehyde dehydrogenase (NAD+)
MADQQGLPRFPLFINGEPCEPTGGVYTPVINPATGETIAEIAQGTADDVDTAVVAARDAFENPEWRKMKPQDRAVLLEQCAGVIMQNMQELAVLESTASGGTLARTMNLDLMVVADVFMTLAEEVRSFPFVENLKSRPVPELTQSSVWKEPIGVCGLITAWNFPLLLLSWKVAPALAAGNTIVIKPAEITPTSTVRIVELLNTVLPKGVLNVVVGKGSVVGERLTVHPDVDKISFTGSTSMGKHVQTNCAMTMKRCTLELGGKGPGIVLPDADLDLTTQGALWGVYMNAGQACESGTRLLVHEDIYDEMVERLVDLSGKIILGNPMEPATGMGPMSTEAHFNTVMDYIQSAREEGARIACGGQRAEVPGCEGGFFVQPTVIADATNQMKAAREEIFGPVLCVIKYSSIEEAIEIANDTEYGLSAGIWTRDLVLAQELARDLRAGSVWINDWHMIRTDAPFGGYKQSGYGREFGKYSLDSYLETKAVNIAFQRDPMAKPMQTLLHTHLLG